MSNNLFSGIFSPLNMIYRSKASKIQNDYLMNELGAVINTFSSGIQNTSGKEVILGSHFEDYFKFLHETSVDKRKSNYHLYKRMEETDPIIAATLNIYADEIIMGEYEADVTKTYEIRTPDPSVKAFLELVDYRTKLKDRIKGIAYSLVQMGESFDEIIFPDSNDPSNNHIPSRLVCLPQETMEVNISMEGDFTDENKAYSQIIQGSQYNRIDFPWWKIIHWSSPVRPDQVYGQSLLYSVRKLYHAIHACVDGVIIERMLRAHQRYKVVVDTGNLQTDDAWNVVKKMQENYKRRNIIDSTGKLHINNIPRTPEEDIWIPSGPEGRSNVEILEGTSQTTKIDDLMFLINYYIAGMHVPKAYLAFEEGTHNKNVISQLDIHHARMVRAYQQHLIRGQKKLYDVSLASVGINPTDVDYRIVYPMIRTEDDMRKWEVMNLKVRLAFMLRTQLGVIIRDEWILSNLLEIPPDELELTGYDPNNTGIDFMMGTMGGGADSGTTQSKTSKGQNEEIAAEIKRQLLRLDELKPEERKNMEGILRHLYDYAELVNQRVKYNTNGRYSLYDIQEKHKGKPSFVIHPDNAVEGLQDPSLNEFLNLV